MPTILFHTRNLERDQELWSEPISIHTSRQNYIPVYLKFNFLMQGEGQHTITLFDKFIDKLFQLSKSQIVQSRSADMRKGLELSSKWTLQGLQGEWGGIGRFHKSPLPLFDPWSTIVVDQGSAKSEKYTSSTERSAIQRGRFLRKGCMRPEMRSMREKRRFMR